MGLKYAGITIDPPGSKDLDDALWIAPTLEGGWQVFVFVAAPGLDVPPRGDLWEQAVTRGETRYFASGARHTMLGAKIEAHHSLTPSASPKPAMLIQVSCQASGDILHPLTQVSLVHLHQLERLHYPQIAALLPSHPRLQTLFDFCLTRLALRAHQGALAAFDDDQGIYLSGEGSPVVTGTRRGAVGHLMVQECMILGNQALAHWCAQRALPVLFRNHQVQEGEEARGLRRALTQALKRQNKAQLHLLDSMIQSALGAATYGPKNQGHWALGLPAYMHATSPLRRAADLINQQQIFAYLAHQPLPCLEPDLLEVAARLETSKQAKRLDHATHGRAQAKHEVLAALDDPAFHVSSAGRFSRFVKTFVRHQGGIDPHVAAQVFAAWNQGDTHWPMPVIHTLLFESEQQTHHIQALEHLVLHPYVAKNLLLHRAQREGEAAEVDPEVGVLERGYTTHFVLEMPEGMLAGPKKSLVAQRWAVVLLARKFDLIAHIPHAWFGLPVPEPEAVQDPLDALPEPDSDHLVAELHTWAKSHATLSVSYRQRAQQHWGCVATLLWTERSWQAEALDTSKSRARMAAYRALVQAMREAPQGGPHLEEE